VFGGTLNLAQSQKLTELDLCTEALWLEVLVNTRFISYMLNKLPFISAANDVMLMLQVSVTRGTCID